MRALLLTVLGMALAASWTGSGAADDRIASRLSYCERFLVDPNAWRQEPDQHWDADVSDPASGGHLYYFGAMHARPVGDPQYARIARLYAGFRPNLVYYEGAQRIGSGVSPAEAESLGEAAFVQALAAPGDVETRSLEPDQGAVLRALTEKFSAEDVEFFFVLRFVAQQTAYWRVSDQRVLRSSTELFIRQELKISSDAGIALPEKNLSDLASAYARYWPGHQWYEADLSWFSPFLPRMPTPPPVETFHRINLGETVFRNQTMYRRLGRELLAGRQIFAVVGRNHVPFQEPALTCLAGNATHPTKPADTRTL